MLIITKALLVRLTCVSFLIRIKAHGKKRSGGITVDSAPLPYSRPLLSLPLDTLSSDEIGDLAVQVVESKGQRQTVAKTNERPLPSRFLHTILMTRMKDN